MQLNVAFLWHMHQPLYLDPVSDRFSMPWVRLHAAKAYTDMVTCLDNLKEARVTFNLAPSLLLQLDLYNRGKSDVFLNVSRKSAGDLASSEKEFIISRFFSCHWPTMVEPYPRYAALLDKRGREIKTEDLPALSRAFSTQDILDLQVWFNLSWLGFSSRGHPLAKSLFEKGRDFSESEKHALLDLHLKIVRDVIPHYARLWGSGQIEISTSPFYHPILPLLIDTNLAERSLPDARLPSRFNYPEDALLQLEKGRDYCAKILGQRPEGLWPSEGAVAPELIPLIDASGFVWTATDEEVLFRSLDSVDDFSLFQPYRVEIDGCAVNMIFRHHHLSDLIGFVYQKNDPNIAVSDFVRRLKDIKKGLEGMKRSPFLAVVLDGENPWEYYQDGGEKFLEELYLRILDDKELNLVTVSEYLEKNPPTKSLDTLHSGSWINGDYGIWIGGEEENRAWDLLGAARKVLDEVERAEDSVDVHRLSSARQSILAAEGSDWFWWYGDQFSTDYALEFDRLFRSHIQQVYRFLGKEVPDGLLVPVKSPGPVQAYEDPVAFIHPDIDGKLSFFWEWAGAGTFKQQDVGGAMHTGEGPLSELAYGFDLRWFYLKIDPRVKKFGNWPDDVSIRVRINGFAEIRIDLFPRREDETLLWDIRTEIDGKPSELSRTGIKIAVAQVAEIAVPFAVLRLQPNEKLTFCVEIVHNGLVTHTIPSKGYIAVTVPDEDFERKQWVV